MENLSENAIKESIGKLLELCSSRKGQVLQLLGYLEKAGFYSAPASASHHNNRCGGLAEHSLGVTETLLRVKGHMFRLPDDQAKFDGLIVSDESCVIVGLFHDVHKVCDGFGRECYVPNVGKSGRVSEAKPYEVNKDMMAFSGSFKSALIISKFVDLREHELQAVSYHDGLYVSSGREISLKEHPLTLMLHFADMWSAILIEDAASWLYRPASESKLCG